MNATFQHMNTTIATPKVYFTSEYICMVWIQEHTLLINSQIKISENYHAQVPQINLKTTLERSQQIAPRYMYINILLTEYEKVSGKYGLTLLFSHVTFHKSRCTLPKDIGYAKSLRHNLRGSCIGIITNIKPGELASTEKSPLHWSDISCAWNTDE